MSCATTELVPSNCVVRSESSRASERLRRACCTRELFRHQPSCFDLCCSLLLRQKMSMICVFQLLCVVLLGLLSMTTTSVHAYSGLAVLPYNVEYALAMVCPNAGDKIAQFTLVADAADGARFDYFYGTSLPLPATVQSTSSLSYISSAPTTDQSNALYFRIRCMTTTGCGLNFDFQYYCKSTTGENLKNNWLSSCAAKLLD